MSNFKISSLYDCLRDDNKIIIPMIQRDYAQGRKAESEKRKAFLNDIKNAIDNENILILDYVYGSKKENVFYPLDGQQRLTTLWLVYWYIAFEHNKLDSSPWLKNFTYNVRVSSVEFCARLCEMTKNDRNIIKGKNENGRVVSIAQYIQNQPWFYSKWVQDPTINSMLRTISGDSIESNDCIEAIFEGSTLEWNRLVNDNQIKIKFNLLEISDAEILHLDNLYVKMNARGKRLSNYENFKSDFVDYIGQKYPENSSYYALNFDTVWADALWRKHNENGEIDDIYFALMNRLFFNEYIIRNKFSSKEKDDKTNKESGVFTTLIANDNKIEYKVFDIYKKILELCDSTTGSDLTEKMLKKWDNFFRLLCYCEKEFVLPMSTVIEGNADSKDGENEEEKDTDITSVSVIPDYDKYLKGVGPTFKDRLYLLAMCEFVGHIKKEDIDTISKKAEDDSGKIEIGQLKKTIFDEYRRWMRISQNLIENSAVENKDAMISAMSLIYKLANLVYSDGDVTQVNVYCKLGNMKIEDIESGDSERSRQLEEEMYKANIIFKGWTFESQDTNNDCEERIVKAEHFSFFNGSIRFLFWDKDGKYQESITRAEFMKKYEKCQELFDDKSKNAKPQARKKFRNVLSDWEKVFNITDLSLTSMRGYNTRAFSWKKSILNNVELANEVYALLCDKSVQIDKFIESRDKIFEKLDKKGEEQPKRIYNCQVINGEPVFHIKGSHQAYIFIGDQRKKFCDCLREKSSITVENEILEGYYCGKTIVFMMGDDKYVWKTETVDKKCENRIYKCQEDSESMNSYKWEQPEALIDELRKFDFVFSKKKQL